MNYTDNGLREKWNSRHQEAAGIGEAAAVVTENLHLLPASGSALDLACGRGANAILLAEKGLEVYAWDFSPVALDTLSREMRKRGLTIHGEERDVISRPPEPNRFDLILVTHFLQRELAPAIMAALRPGGLLFYQTFTRSPVVTRGPSDPRYRLGENELLELFGPLKIHFYREEGQLGDPALGHREMAMLVAQKP
jgi:SAM-dependent methyltransferase